jgi:hypothetical protein
VIPVLFFCDDEKENQIRRERRGIRRRDAWVAEFFPHCSGTISRTFRPSSNSIKETKLPTEKDG